MTWALHSVAALVLDINFLENDMQLRAFVSFFVVLMSFGPAYAEGDAKKGKSVFKRCLACHDIKKEKNKVGPHLVGIVGRKGGIAEKYKYSKSLLAKAAEGLVWDEASLDTYLEKPKSVHSTW